MIARSIEHASTVAVGFCQMALMAWRAQPLALVALLLLTVCEALTGVASAWLTKWIFEIIGDRLGIGMGMGTLPDLQLILVAQAALLILGQVIAPAMAHFNGEVARQLTVNVQSQVFRKIGGFAGLGFFENPEFHDLLLLAGQGAQSGPLHSVAIFTTMVHSSLTIITFLGILVAFGPLLAGAVALAALVHLVGQLRLGRQHHRMAEEAIRDERRAFYYGHVLSSLEPAKEVRVFGLSEYFLGKLLTVYRGLHSARRDLALRGMTSQLLWQTPSSIVSVSALAIVVDQTFSGILSIGDVTLYLSAVRAIQGALSAMVLALSSLNQQVLLFSHYRQLMLLPQPISLSPAPRIVPRLSSGLAFSNVWFRYTDRRPWVLKGVNLFIPAGKCLALVGRNGAGKSTLINLMTRLYDPTEGQILWDGIDIREFDPDDLRRHLGIVFQDPFHYALTAQENIGLGEVRDINNEARVRSAAEEAFIHEKIALLPQGFQTVLSRWLDEDGLGTDLSGGEWQKIAIARLFMRQPDVIILDEPTSMLDLRAQHDLHGRLANWARNRTTLLVSHRPETIATPDLIAVLEEGRIAEHGTCEELRASNGLHAMLCKLHAP